MKQPKVWLVNEGENLPGDDNNPRLQRMGLLAFELEKLGTKVIWWQSTFNHYQKKFRYHEDKLLSAADDVDRVYVEEVLPAKMVWNLESIRRFRFLREILTMFRTVLAVLGKDYRRFQVMEERNETTKSLAGK